MSWYWGLFYGMGLCGVCLPLYLLLRLIFAAVQHERSDHSRTRAGRCVRCGYLLTGLVNPRCPECGQGFELPGAQNATPCEEAGAYVHSPVV